MPGSLWASVNSRAEFPHMADARDSAIDRVGPDGSLALRKGFMTTFYEPGSALPITSLAGVVSLPGQGRVVTNGTQAVSAPANLLPSNPKRISAVIQNIDTTDKILVYLGPAGGQAPIYLLPGGTLQIDKDFPWTGEVNVWSSAGAPVVNYIEISLQ